MIDGKKIFARFCVSPTRSLFESNTLTPSSMSQLNRVAFQLVSDLHLEFDSEYETFEIPPCAPYLGLLGDIGLTNDTKLFSFLERQLGNFKAVFFVFGNHEAYESSIEASKLAMSTFRDTCNAKRTSDPSMGEFIILDQTRYDVNEEVTVLGCTLFSNIISRQYYPVMFGLNDFEEVKDWTVEKYKEAHDSDVAWLNEQLTRIREESPQRRVLILTHHSPTIAAEANDERHAGSKISSAFRTDLIPGHIDLKQVTAWVYGHTHYNADIQVEETRVFSNQRGYASSVSSNFNVEKTINV